MPGLNCRTLAQGLGVPQGLGLKRYPLVIFVLQLDTHQCTVFVFNKRGYGSPLYDSY